MGTSLTREEHADTTIARGRPGRVACDISDGARQFVADLGPGQGGEDLGPDPGVLIRAGLAACLVSGYQLWAAHMGITLDDVEVTRVGSVRELQEF